MLRSRQTEQVINSTTHNVLSFLSVADSSQYTSSEVVIVHCVDNWIEGAVGERHEVSGKEECVVPVR